MKWYVYSINPIDFWAGWQRPHDVFRVQTNYAMSPHPFFDAQRWQPAWDLARKGARELGWEMDIREGPYVAPLPVPDSGSTHFMIAWKHDNNGTTFVASPFELPWLDEGDNSIVVDERGVWHNKQWYKHKLQTIETK